MSLSNQNTYHLTKKTYKRTTPEQIRCFTNFLREHPEINFSDKNQNRMDIEAVWRQLSAKLNAIEGPNRSVKRWKEAFRSWKYQLRKRDCRKKSVSSKRKFGKTLKTSNISITSGLSRISRAKRISRVKRILKASKAKKSKKNLRATKSAITLSKRKSQNSLPLIKLPRTWSALLNDTNGNSTNVDIEMMDTTDDVQRFNQLNVPALTSFHQLNVPASFSFNQLNVPASAASDHLNLTHLTSHDQLHIPGSTAFNQLETENRVELCDVFSGALQKICDGLCDLSNAIKAINLNEAD